ncbi:MAG: FAD-dependent oxidoreductase [Parcubacteria group bacterium]|nr:FAD-dependent oxidoreductase [Parcubacteria group bacterium]
MNEFKEYDVIVIGGGVTGTAILFMLSNYTNVRRIALVEKYGRVAQVNSSPANNSQTLHFGDIETNYPFDKALVLKEAAEMMVQYVEKRKERNLFRKTHKMVLAVGKDEVRTLEERYRTFRNAYPNLKRIDKEEISRIEPKITEGRNTGQELLALLSDNGYAINYQKLSESFLADSFGTDKVIDLFFDTEVKAIEKENGVYVVKTEKEILKSRVVAAASGPYSLLFAQSLGYGEELGILPVAGSFYFSDKLLNGKVYTMQIEKIPFAAIHGDPDVVHTNETRYGPTAKVLPLLERHKYKTIFDFLKTPLITIRGLISLFRVLSDWTLFAFVMKNAVYDMPIMGKWLFLSEVRKIIPSMKYRMLKFGKGLGGIRPQVINLKTKTLQMGEAKIIGDNIIFVTTPSPGASVCLKNAETDVRTIVRFLGSGFTFDEEKFQKDLKS